MVQMFDTDSKNPLLSGDKYLSSVKKDSVGKDTFEFYPPRFNRDEHNKETQTILEIYHNPFESNSKWIFSNI
jgi:hypothetical protein